MRNIYKELQELKESCYSEEDGYYGYYEDKNGVRIGDKVKNYIRELKEQHAVKDIKDEWIYQIGEYEDEITVVIAYIDLEDKLHQITIEW